MTENATPDLHALAQHLTTASLSVDAARAWLDQGETERLRQCLDAAAAALIRGTEWINAQRAGQGQVANQAG